ncbi:MAG: DNA adenine methylase [Solirubrobacteraceae bacterium]
MSITQPRLFSEPPSATSVRSRPRGQILKWVGNKYRYADVIARHFPADFETYYEPFVGTGAVLATLRPDQAVASDTLPMLVALLRAAQADPGSIIDHYRYWRDEIVKYGRDAYMSVRDRYNDSPNALDLMVISRTCYGGVMRFTRQGHISTPMGPHRPITADSLDNRMRDWTERIRGAHFVCQSFEDTIAEAGDGDLVYCDPPYLHGQSILYGAQDFRLETLWDAVESAVARRAAVAVSMDGWRKSGEKAIDLAIPGGLFQRELIIERGGCMLRRFQMSGEDMAHEQVADRLLLSW